jgi:hypothetical protein
MASRIRFGIQFTLVTFVLASACAGSDGPSPRACTGIGCVDGLSVDFSRPLRESGAYRITLELDGERVTCEATLPFASCSADGGCSSPDVLLLRSGCALPAQAHELTGIQVKSAPVRARIVVERAGVAVADEEFAPSYVRSQPNGEGCGPICEQARVSLAVP